MNINQVLPPAQGFVAPQQSAKPLTIEVSLEDVIQNRQNLMLSQDAINLHELSQTYPEMFAGPSVNLPGSTLHQVNQLMLLHRTMRTAYMESSEQSSNPLQQTRRFELNELAAAYNHVMQTTNAGNRHLDDAFRNLARYMLVTPATHQARNDWWSTADADGLNRNQNPELTHEQRASQNSFVADAIAEAERQATLFSNVFLSNHREFGIQAFSMAMEAISR
ncbi:MAG: hypothetical protein FWC89_03125 [Defluviitaleaceae bacterium]|nr:hypothetical protein [Defluviitaleaceae bacterium]